MLAMSRRSAATFAHQATLPRLPVPPLSESLAKYLRSVEALATPPQLAVTRTAVAEFAREGGIGQTLQTRLLEHDKTQPGSWLERWWLTLAYHGWRDPLLINSNWYMICHSPPGETPKDLLDESTRKDGIFTPYQIRRAAGLVTRFLDYKQMIDTETLPVETTKAGPLCMDQYRRVFGVTRVPRNGVDENVGSHPFHSRCITVSVRDQFYVVDVLDNAGKRVTIGSIEKQLWKVVEDVSRSDTQPPIGVLTSEHRDTWAEVYAHLESLNPVNKTSIRKIQSGIFNLALDDYFLPNEPVYLARNTFYGKGARNRWYDKSLNLTIMADGRFGVNGEHSPCDALVPAYIVDYAARHEPFVEPNGAVEADLPQPEKLKWVVDATITKAIETADVNAKRLIDDSDVHLMYYNAYGADLIKKKAKVSPDAFVQMALQLTYQRMIGDLPAVYETASTRKYNHGRTETCRSLSVDSVAFMRVFEDPKISAKDKVAALQKACTAHVNYISAAANGHGVDRHLLGLRCLLKPEDGPTPPAIFTDPMYARSQRWDLSTSALFPGEVIAGTGFGAVYPDPAGFGMNYVLYAGKLQMGVECKRRVMASRGGSRRFGEVFSGVLDEMRGVVEKAEEGAASAKL